MAARTPFRPARIGSSTVGLLLAVSLSAAGVEAAGQSAFPMHSQELTTRLTEALAARGSDYVPRTEHVDGQGRPQYTNRLILEDSPYLLQHAHNPVDWYPWGPEAFERAAAEGKPVFLSIGYSTCHWCHVMERESFENEELAAVLNREFICVKVDREQRPDVDEVYMTAVQLQTGHGGWPMSSFLTPDRDPFFGGTYFPPEQFGELLQAVSSAWRDRREEVEVRAARVSEAVKAVLSTRSEAGVVDDDGVEAALRAIVERSDPQFGGPGGAPKFPHESDLLLMLDAIGRSPRDEWVAPALQHLGGLARGGIHDQVGGGFHRYSVDERWLVPHFEKMLYNQALLARAFTRAARVFGDWRFARVARSTLDYVLREMQAPEGGFYSATDADSEGEEGLFFVWDVDQLRGLLGADAPLVERLWGVTQEGNFEGSNILHLAEDYPEFAQREGLEVTDLLSRVDNWRQSLLAAREERAHPLRDDKRLLGWNGMMVTALAEASVSLGEERYLLAARRASESLWRSQRSSEGRFLRIWLDGNTTTPALLEDHAFFAEGLLALYDATEEPIWLLRAVEVVAGMNDQFWDEAHGGYFSSSPELAPYLIAQPRSSHDGATPSGNSVALRVLARLERRTGDPAYRRRGEALLAAFADGIVERPLAHPYLLTGFSELRFGEVGAAVWGAGGKVRVRAREIAAEAGDVVSSGVKRLELELRIADGWHVNSATPRQAELIPTVVRDSSAGPRWKVASSALPDGDDVVVAFEDEPISVYSGTVTFGVEMARVGGATSEVHPLSLIPLTLEFQACDDRLCLQPEALELRVPLALAEAGLTTPDVDQR